MREVQQAVESAPPQKKEEEEEKNKALFVCGRPRFYPCVAERCLALQISALTWTDTGGLCWPCSLCLRPLRSAMQIHPNERAAEAESAGDGGGWGEMGGRKGNKGRMKCKEANEEMYVAVVREGRK